MHNYLRHYVAASTEQFAREEVGHSRRMSQLAKQHLPYALFHREDGRMLVLNREYKPLGWPGTIRGWVDYESPEFLLLTIEATDTAGAEAPGRMVHLYDAVPWKDGATAAEYRAKIAELFGIEDFERNDGPRLYA